MRSNRGVVYLGPGKVDVQNIDFATFHNPAGRRSSTQRPPRRAPLFFVIPAKAGTQGHRSVAGPWAPAFAGVTGSKDGHDLSGSCLYDWRKRHDYSH